MAHYSLTEVYFPLCGGYLKKQRNENMRNTEKMDPYRNTVHLEDKREEFENCYKLER